MSGFRNFDEFASWLAAQGLFRMRLGLDRMWNALAGLDLLKPPFIIAQVLGTNGKGSTSAFLSSLASAHNVSAGLYTSPHFLSPIERIRVNGRTLPKSVWLRHANDIFASCNGNPDLSYFEFLTVLALLAFRECGVRVAILEAGLGGASDATTACMPVLQIFTPIAMDHAAIIGPGIADIARDKAGAIKRGLEIVSAHQYPICRRIIEDRAATCGIAPQFFPPLPHDMACNLGLGGNGQLVNAGVALGAWRILARELGIHSENDTRMQGLRSAFLAGRLQRIAGSTLHPPCILDGAHNPHGMQWLLREFTGPTAPPPPRAIIFSCLGDKDWTSSLGLLCRAFPDVPMFIPRLNNERAAPVDDIASFRHKLLPGALTRTFSQPRAMDTAVAEAARVAPDGPLLVTGSLYLLAEFFRLYPQYLNPPKTAAW